MALEMRGVCERCGAELALTAPRRSARSSARSARPAPSDRARLPELRRRARRPAAPRDVTGARHLYVHLPFCASRCGYCDFVTVVGRDGEHGRYVDALLRELELERHLLADPLETVYLGGGTPTFTEPAALERLLAALPAGEELTVEANPGDGDAAARGAAAPRRRRPCLARRADASSRSCSRTLDRAAHRTTSGVRSTLLRDAGFDNISLDLIYGIPGQSRADLERDLAEALALEPEHVSAYELEAKPGTRFTHAHGAELERQAEAMESYFELVVETLTAAGYRWYETANFCRAAGRAGRDLRARHNLGYWLGHDYLGLGVGAVSTIDRSRWRNAPSLARYLAALERGERPPREIEELSPAVRETERLMLGLRLDEPLPLDGARRILDDGELERLERLGLVVRERRHARADATAAASSAAASPPGCSR